METFCQRFRTQSYCLRIFVRMQQWINSTKRVTCNLIDTGEAGSLTQLRMDKTDAVLFGRNTCNLYLLMCDSTFYSGGDFVRQDLLWRSGHSK